jgi:cytochrome c oxidase subunit 4
MAHAADSLAHGAGHEATHGEHGSEHPGERKYIEIAMILAGITVIEVAIYYIQWVHDKGLLVPMLMAMSAVKFTVVVGFFMHLKFDDRRLTYMFVTGLLFAFSIIMALYALFHWNQIEYAANLL